MSSRPSPAVYRRRRIVVGSVLLVLAVIGTYLPVALLAPVPAAVASVPDVAPRVTDAAPLATPAAGSSAIGLAGGAADAPRALGSSGSPDPVPIASITKTITALVVLDEKPIADGGQGPDIAITDTDAQYLADTIAVGGSWASVYPGQVLTERQVLEIMLLESANNYSLTLTTWAFGSVDAYLAAATTWIADHGLSGTAVVDTSGLDPGSRSTTSDLLTIGSLVMADPVLSAIVGTATDQLPQLGEIQNTNTLIGSDGIDGIKTGTTDEAGRCLLFSADVTVGDETVALVGVVLGAASDDDLHASVLALLESAQAGFRTVDVVTAGDVIGRYTTEWGESADVVAEQTVTTTVWSSATVSRTAEVDDVTSGASGTEVGTARFTVEGIALDGTEFTVPLTLASTLDGPDAGWKLSHPGRLFG
ncbi:D-alanyl-D-alanine carboxypeptidase family protein [Herbiconiux daphne]|uniref:D-alanyl-D-alanine carboxypeptidase n=1 Tax=Herbiconiux daphne TaxID=2970914 RepID=A0ABT2H087_9MICO|nr:D-alanyl-D-alanine carboxypeptidase [Herbiconiux daphne]MCS5733347.1 D-alanyl-D-alanine carboxypeptidase [Herbiconiux daphne]